MVPIAVRVPNYLEQRNSLNSFLFIGTPDAFFYDVTTRRRAADIFSSVSRIFLLKSPFGRFYSQDFKQEKIH